MIEARQDQGIIYHDLKTTLNLRKLNYKIKLECKKLYLEFKDQIKQKIMLKYLPITKPTLSKLKGKDMVKTQIKSNPFDSKIKEQITELVLTPTVGKNVGKNFLSITKLLIALRNKEIPASYYPIKQIFIENDITNTIRKPKKNNSNNKSTEESNFFDLTKDYKEKKIIPVIGFDGTMIKLLINDVLKKFTIIFFINWNSNYILGFSIMPTETKKNIITALEKCKTKIDELNLKNVEFIVQRDRGTGGLSSEVSQFIEQEMNAKNSSSLSQFKGNQTNECLNRWFKKELIEFYGNAFESLEEFIVCMEEVYCL